MIPKLVNSGVIRITWGLAGGYGDVGDFRSSGVGLKFDHLSELGSLNTLINKPEHAAP
jgi:hypothetical protein